MDAHCLESSLEKLLREAQYGDTGTRDLVVGTLSLLSDVIDKLNERKVGIETSAPIDPIEALLQRYEVPAGMNGQGAQMTTTAD